MLSGIKCSIHLFYIHQSVYFVILTEPDQRTKAVHNALFSPISTKQDEKHFNFSQYILKSPAEKSCQMAKDKQIVIHRTRAASTGSLIIFLTALIILCEEAAGDIE